MEVSSYDGYFQRSMHNLHTKAVYSTIKEPFTILGFCILIELYHIFRMDDCY